jgi:hypothetical protein
MAIQLQNHWMIQIKLNDMIKLTEVQAWEDVGLEHANEMGEQHADFTTSTSSSCHSSR